MKPHDRYLLSLAAVFTLTIVVFSMYGENRLDLYFSLLVLEYFIITSLHSPFKNKTEKMLNCLGFVLFAIFMYIVINRILSILF
ncbi:MAG: hypothetical protein ACTSXX_10145 [Candidatus Baldrarchaeia archaeon]